MAAPTRELLVCSIYDDVEKDVIHIMSTTPEEIGSTACVEFILATDQVDIDHDSNHNNSFVYTCTCTCKLHTYPSHDMHKGPTKYNYSLGFSHAS